MLSKTYIYIFSKITQPVYVIEIKSNKSNNNIVSCGTLAITTSCFSDRTTAYIV